MQCIFEWNGERWKCKNCPNKMRADAEADPLKLNATCRSNKTGPGTELHKLTAQLKLPRKSGCTCAALERRMDLLGVEGCREHRAELLAELTKNFQLYDAKDKLTAAWHSLTTGLAVRINPLDPLGSLLDLAINRAESTVV